jgi:hypothetical protein
MANKQPIGMVTIFILDDGTVDVQSPYSPEDTQELFKKLGEATVSEVRDLTVEAPEGITEQEEE